MTTAKIRWGSKDSETRLHVDHDAARSLATPRTTGGLPPLQRPADVEVEALRPPRGSRAPRHWSTSTTATTNSGTELGHLSLHRPVNIFSRWSRLGSRCCTA